MTQQTPRWLTGGQGEAIDKCLAACDLWMSPSPNGGMKALLQQMYEAREQVAGWSGLVRKACIIRGIGCPELDALPEAIPPWIEPRPLCAELPEDRAAWERLETLLKYLKGEIHELPRSAPADKDKPVSRGEDVKTNVSESGLPPALTKNQAEVLKTMDIFDASALLSARTTAGEMHNRVSEETVRASVVKLIELRLAERPEGPRSGARLTRDGRKLASRIED